MLADWLIYLLVGKLFIWLWMRFPLPVRLERFTTLKYLHSCDLCSGVHLYALLSLIMQIDILTVLGFHYVPFFSEYITGGIVSFIVWLLSIGWREAFTPTIEV